MAPDHQSPFQIQVPLASNFRLPTRRGVLLRRRRKLPTIRLGGKNVLVRRGHFLMRVLRRMRVKCLKAYHARMLKKLKEFYHNLVKDIIEGGATMQAYQQRLLMETSFAVPVLGVSLSNFPSTAGSEYYRRYM